MQYEDKLFNEAEQTWILDKLYSDLDSHNKVSPSSSSWNSTQKAILRALLIELSPAQIVNNFSKVAEEDIINTIWLIYEEVRKLTHHPSPDTQNLNNIIEWLDQAGYRKTEYQCHCDWNIAPDKTKFFGYIKEQEILKYWLVNVSNLVLVWGRKGYGKTSLVSKVSKENKDIFKKVIWRSLRHSNSFERLFREIISFISPQIEISSSPSPYELISAFIKALQENHSLVILDNWDAILEKEDNKLYGELIEKIGQISHSSCLVLISTEKPREFEELEEASANSLYLKGLRESAKDVFKAKGLLDEHLYDDLLSVQPDDPLTINKVTKTIKQHYNGSVEAFLQASTFIVDQSVHHDLEKQLQSLSHLEVEILRLLGTYVHLTVEEIRKQLNKKNYKSGITKSVNTLLRKALIEYIIVDNKQCLKLPTLVREEIVKKYNIKKNAIVKQAELSTPSSSSPSLPDNQNLPSPPTTICEDSYPIISQNLASFEEGEGVRPMSRWIRFAGLSIGVTTLVVFLVSYFLPYQVTVKAKATVRPTGKLKIVEAETSGRITEIRVKENQPVTKGEILAVVDDSSLKTQKEQLEKTFSSLQKKQHQINSQIEAQDNVITAKTNEMNSVTETAKAQLRQARRNHQDKTTTAQANVDEAKANLAQAQHEAKKAEAELTSAQATLQESQATLDATLTKQKRYEELPRGALPLNELEEVKMAVTQQKAAVETAKAQVERQKQSLESSHEGVKAAKERLRARIATLNPSNEEVRIAQERITQQESTIKATLANLSKEKEVLLQQQTETKKEIHNTRLELQKVQYELEKTIIKAVEDGTIFKMNLTNPDQTVQTGEQLFTIVPRNAPLEIKANVAPQDKNDLQEGATVHMRVSACPYPDYGTLKGRVNDIATDVTPSQNDQTKDKTGNFYEVTILPDSLSIGKKNNKCPIVLVLEGNVDIIAKEESYLSFFLRKARLISNF